MAVDRIVKYLKLFWTSLLETSFYMLCKIKDDDKKVQSPADTMWRRKSWNAARAHVQCEAAHREIHYKYIFLILKIPEIAQIEKSFNYFSHKVLGLIKLIK